jgi:hypothetical protein
MLKRVDAVSRERDEACADVDALRELVSHYDLHPPVRMEPSRLEIAAMLYKGMLSSGYIWGDPEKTAIRSADALIAAAKEVAK